VDIEAYPAIDGLPMTSFSIPYVVAPKVDLDGDRVLDAVFGVESYDGSAGIFTIRGGSHLNSQQPIFATRLPSPDFNPDDSLYHDVTTGDFNDDTHTDFVITRPTSLTVYFGGNDTEEIPSLTVESGDYRQPGEPSPKSLKFDVNGDGADDLLVGRPTDSPRDESGSAGSVSVLLGRRTTDLSGEGEVDQLFEIAPGEQLTLRISGTITDETLNQDLAIELAVRDDQHEMNPFNNRARIEQADTLFADTNQNGTIDFADFLILSENFGRETESIFDGDLNGDQRVDFADFLLLSSAYSDGPPRQHPLR